MGKGLDFMCGCICELSIWKSLANNRVCVSVCVCSQLMVLQTLFKTDKIRGTLSFFVILRFHYLMNLNSILSPNSIMNTWGQTHFAEHCLSPLAQG